MGEWVNGGSHVGNLDEEEIVFGGFISRSLH